MDKNFPATCLSVCTQPGAIGENNTHTTFKGCGIKTEPERPHNPGSSMTKLRNSHKSKKQINMQQTLPSSHHHPPCHNPTTLMWSAI